MGASAFGRVATGRDQRLGFVDTVDHGGDHAGGTRVEHVPGQRRVHARQADQGGGTMSRDRADRVHGRTVVEEAMLEVDGDRLGASPNGHHLGEVGVGDGKPGIARRLSRCPGSADRSCRRVHHGCLPNGCLVHRDSGPQLECHVMSDMGKIRVGGVRMPPAVHDVATISVGEFNSRSL